MKKMIAAMLCLLLCVACFAGCGSKADTWTLNMRALSAMAAANSDYGTMFEGYSDDVMLAGVSVSMDEESMTVQADVDAIAGSVDKFMNTYVKFLENGGLYTLFEQTGTDRETVDKMLAAQGTDMDKMIQQTKDALETSFSSHDLAVQIAEVYCGTVSGSHGERTFPCVDNQTHYVITVDGEEVILPYTLEGSKLTITAPNGVYELIREN